MLAAEVGVPVPEIRLGEVEGKAGTHAISVAFGKESIDLLRVRQLSGIVPGLKTALSKGSGLLAFHAWSATGDLKEDHVLVAVDSDTDYRVAAIDFASAFAWDLSGGAMATPTTEPKGLVENVDKVVVADTVGRIEQVTDQRIQEIAEGIPESVLPAAERQRVVIGLIKRRAMLRNYMRTKGWIA